MAVVIVDTLDKDIVSISNILYSGIVDWVTQHSNDTTLSTSVAEAQLCHLLELSELSSVQRQEFADEVDKFRLEIEQRRGDQAAPGLLEHLNDVSAFIRRS